MKHYTSKRASLLVLVLAAALFFSAVPPMQAQEALAAAATDFVAVDLSSTLNQNDQPFGITCDNSDGYVYMTIFQQGMLAKIDKSTKAVTLIEHPEGPLAAGRGFYSIAHDASGNIFVNEVNNGKVWQYNPESEAWVPIPIVEEITGNPKVTYPSGFTAKPNLIRIDENPSGHGFHTYHVNMASYGGLVYANGYIWAGLQYNVDFDTEAETIANVTDMQFSGLARIDPSSLTVERIAIAGSTAPSAMSVDEIDPSTIWVTDNGADKVYKVDAATGTVAQTISLAADSRPRGIDNDQSFLYVALDKFGDGSDNSQILKIDKADTASQAIIDTTAPNTEAGTFNVFVAGSNLVWTDGSAHVGKVNLSTDEKTFNDTSFGQSNRFGCLATPTEFWWASHGSVVAGILDLSEPEEAPTADEEDDSPKTISRGSKGNPVKPEDMPGYCSPAEMADLVATFHNSFADGQIPPINEYVGDFAKTERSFHYIYYVRAYQNATGHSFDDLDGPQRATVLKVLGYDRDKIGAMTDSQMQAIQTANAAEEDAPKVYKPVNPAKGAREKKNQ